MKQIKNIIRLGLCCMTTLVATSCDDYFEPDNATFLDGDNYIKEQSELYSGYLGVINKLQDVGDKAIYLTDTRAELLEPTGNNDELVAIYNYEPDLAGNSYADPAKYYDLVIACNDYLAKAKAYKDAHAEAIDEDHYQGLVSCIIRLKAWTYFTMAKIYGQVVWFDDPMLTLQDIDSFEMLDLDETLERCALLLGEGFDGVDGNHTMDWAEWILSVNADDATVGDYYYWNKMVPDYFVLAADIALWRGEYQKVIDLILPAMNEVLITTELRSGSVTWLCAGSYGSNYSKFFDATTPNSLTTVDVITYDYANGQRNYLIQHFYNDYMLRPSVVGAARYSDYVFNPRAEDKVDRRYTNFIGERDGQLYFHKYRRLSGSARSNSLQDDVHIYLYRSVDLYFMLAEAFNQIQQPEVSASLINNGINTKFLNEGILYHPLFNEWTTKPLRGSRVYPDTGIRGNAGLDSLSFSLFKETEEYTEIQTRDTLLRNDILMLRERILEQPGEGKTYEAMLRVARRYGDYSIITDFVTPKYPNENQQEIVRQRILAGGYFVPWDLKKKLSVH